MKECPNCRRVFVDGSLNFCRMDGTRLVTKATSAQEAMTILFSTGTLNDRFGPLIELRRRKGDVEE